MQFKSIILALCLTTFTLAAPKEHKNNNGTMDGHDGAKDHKGGKHHEKNGTHANSEKAMCKEMTKLTKLTDLVNNATKLQEMETKHNLTATQIDEIKAKAANATTKLTELKANATLTSQCAVIDAGEKTKSQCKEMSKLTKLMDLMNNATALSELESKKNLTAAEMTKLKDEAAKAGTKLNKLKSNSTLMTACENLKTAKNGSSGNGNAASSSGAIRTMNGAGLLGNGLFALVMGGMVAMLMV